MPADTTEQYTLDNPRKSALLSVLQQLPKGSAGQVVQLFLIIIVALVLFSRYIQMKPAKTGPKFGACSITD